MRQLLEQHACTRMSAQKGGEIGNTRPTYFGRFIINRQSVKRKGKRNVAFFLEREERCALGGARTDSSSRFACMKVMFGSDGSSLSVGIRWYSAFNSDSVLMNVISSSGAASASAAAAAAAAGAGAGAGAASTTAAAG